jgi:hypothetical protein
MLKVKEYMHYADRLAVMSQELRMKADEARRAWEALRAQSVPHDSLPSS